MANLADYGVATNYQQRNLRACMVCSIVLLQSKFVSTGCPNCESFLSLAGSPDSVIDCTSSNFNGIIALAEPRTSWVARWQRLDKYVPGMYAVQVIGSLPEDVHTALENAGVRYVPRDGTKDEEGEGAVE